MKKPNRRRCRFCQGVLRKGLVATIHPHCVALERVGGQGSISMKWVARRFKKNTGQSLVSYALGRAFSKGTSS